MAKHHPDLIMCRKQPGIGVSPRRAAISTTPSPATEEKGPLSALAPVPDPGMYRVRAAAVGRLCEKCDGKCPVCDSYVRPCVLVRICDECNYGSYQGRCVICGGPGISDAYYCKECNQQEKDRDGCPKIINLGSSKTVPSGPPPRSSRVASTMGCPTASAQRLPESPKRSTLRAANARARARPASIAEDWLTFAPSAGPVLRAQKVRLQEAVTKAAAAHQRGAARVLFSELARAVYAACLGPRHTVCLSLHDHRRAGGVGEGTRTHFACSIADRVLTVDAAQSRVPSATAARLQSVTLCSALEGAEREVPSSVLHCVVFRRIACYMDVCRCGRILGRVGWRCNATPRRAGPRLCALHGEARARGQLVQTARISC